MAGQSKRDSCRKFKFSSEGQHLTCIVWCSFVAGKYLNFSGKAQHEKNNKAWQDEIVQVRGYHITHANKMKTKFGPPNLTTYTAICVVASLTMNLPVIHISTSTLQTAIFWGHHQNLSMQLYGIKKFKRQPNKVKSYCSVLLIRDLSFSSQLFPLLRSILVNHSIAILT